MLTKLISTFKTALLAAIIGLVLMVSFAVISTKINTAFAADTPPPPTGTADLSDAVMEIPVRFRAVLGQGFDRDKIPYTVNILVPLELRNTADGTFPTLLGTVVTNVATIGEDAVPFTDTGTGTVSFDPEGSVGMYVYVTFEGETDADLWGLIGLGIPPIGELATIQWLSGPAGPQEFYEVRTTSDKNIHAEVTGSNVKVTNPGATSLTYTVLPDTICLGAGVGGHPLYVTQSGSTCTAVTPSNTTIESLGHGLYVTLYFQDVAVGQQRPQGHVIGFVVPTTP